MRKHQLPGVFEEKRHMYTRNLIPGTTHFAENTVVEDGIEYREWDPRRSKLCAGIVKGMSQTGIREKNVILYLGASHGYTPSFVSDIIGPDGFMFALDFAPRVVRDLVYVSELRSNMSPILADANKPETYAHLVSEVDVIFQDISQKNQVEIFLKNMQFYLKKGGIGLLALKARSVDTTKDPRIIFDRVKRELEQATKIVDQRILDPFEKDHMLFVVKN